MKNIKLLFLFLLPVFLFAQTYTGGEASRIVDGAVEVRMSAFYDGPDYIRFAQGREIPYEDFRFWASKALNLDEDYSLVELDRFTGPVGYEHVRLHLHHQGIPVLDGMLLLHIKDGQVVSLNGSFPPVMNPVNGFSISDDQAFQRALGYVDAPVYKWEVAEEEQFIKYFMDDTAATFFPDGKKAIIPTTHQGEPAYAYAWMFDVYAHDPVYRADIYVDGETGEILLENKTIHHIDSLGTAETKYSGTRPITTDYHNNQFRLRETVRGNGVETYNMNNSTSYNNAVDFTNPDNYWDIANASMDEAALDAHWGSEMAYDYFYHEHNRNSIDDNGHKLISFVHFDVNYVNAFWNGQFMTYGDGNGSSITPLTALDIVAHEITHGLTSHTANLIYQDESGALNEGFSDIFAAAVEKWARPNNYNWDIGEDIGIVIRAMDTPNAYNLPHTYHGNYWYHGTGDNGGVHTNMAPMNYWFYLITDGGSGVNDNNDSYSVTGMGMDSAAAIAYRMLTVYLTPSSQYVDARYYAIKAATDLYGACSQPVESVTNAMYAIGVGDPYVPGVQADFTSGISQFCQPPATVSFQNLSNNGINYTWNFGDGNTSTAHNPVHTYTQYGEYTVSLIADGDACGVDSIIRQKMVSVQDTNPCHSLMPKQGNVVTTKCHGMLYDDGGPHANYSDETQGSITIMPPGAQSIELIFSDFHFEAGYDYVNIYEGATTSGNQVGSYHGSSLPNGGNPIIINDSAVTIEQVTDQYVNESGFAMEWNCQYPQAAPQAAFSVNDTVSCNGLAFFNDHSSYGPTSWTWHFGDGNTSSMQNPSHQFSANGIYNVQLRVENAYGSDTLLKSALIRVDIPDAVFPDTLGVCDGDPVTVQLPVSHGVPHWYSDPYMQNLVDTGKVFSPVGVSQDTTFYVSNSATRKPVFGAKLDNSGGGGIFSSPFEHFLVFDVYTDMLLKNVKVYAGNAGTRLILLRDANGNVLHSANVFIPAGESRVDLNFNIPAGVNYELAGPVSPGLFRNMGNLDYPYTAEGLFSIKYSSAGTDPTGFYYYFYDWEVIPQACQTAAEPVRIKFFHQMPIADFSLQINQSLVTFDNQSAEGLNYFWDFGDGNTSKEKNPVWFYNQTGTYHVKLLVENPCGVDSMEKTITITQVGMEEHQEEEQINIYPNPAQNLLNVTFGDNIKATRISLYDVSGKLVMDKELPAGTEGAALQLHLEPLEPGMYFLQVDLENAVVRKKVMVI